MGVFVTKRERLDLIQQGDDMFLEVQERLYDAKAQCTAPEKAKLVTLLETFTVYGSLDAVTDLYLKDDVKMVLDFSESRELVVLKPTTKQRPFDRTSLRWSLFRSPSRLFGKDQDFCYLEVMKPFATADGRRGWARCSNSIQHKAFLMLQSAQQSDVNRSELFYCGLFFEETDQLGVLEATVFYNIKGYDAATSVLMPWFLRAQSKRTIELVNHYLKMSSMILKSWNVSLTRALQLQAERRCGACANHLTIWKRREKCVLCGSLMCEKCNDIVPRNYRVDRVTRGQVVCFACAHRRGTKITFMTETNYINVQANGDSELVAMTHSSAGTYQERLPHGSSLPWSSEDHPKCFNDESHLSLLHADANQVRQQSTPCQRRENVTPNSHSKYFLHETFYLPTTKKAEHQRRRCNTRVSNSRPRDEGHDDFIELRQRRMTGNSRLSTRAKPTGCPPPQQRSATLKYGSKACASGADFNSVGSQIGPVELEGKKSLQMAML